MSNVLQLKVSLRDSQPVIWRRIQISDASTFADLHDAIRDAMGWDGSHLHGFELFTTSKKHPQYIGPQSEDSSEDTLPERKELVKSWLSGKSVRCDYTYDYGDNWDHTVVLEKVVPAEAGATYPRCIAGEQACPPEDCGGIWGYYDKLDILKDPKNEECEWTLEWMGEDFDPAAFDPASVSFLGDVEAYSPWIDDEDDEDEDDLSLEIDTMEDARHELDHPGAKVSFEAIEYMRATKTDKALVDHIVLVLDNAYNQRLIQADLFHDTSPLWYAVVAEAHLDERLIGPVVRLVATEEGDWDLLSEQANRLICLLAEKFPDKTARAVMQAIDRALEHKSKAPYIYLFDIFAVVGVKKYEKWLRNLANHPDNPWADSAEQMIEQAKTGSTAKPAHSRNADWRVRYANFHRDLTDAQNDDFRYVANKPYIATPKIGRNELCPCGSGKKFKKCHGQPG